MENLKFGIMSYFKTPRLRAVGVLYVVVASASSMMIINTVVILGGSESATAIAMAVSGMGSITAALFLPGILRQVEIRSVLFTGSFLLVLCLFLAIGISGLSLLLIVWFFIGAGLAMVQTPVGSLLRLSSHESDSPAYFSANFSISHLCWLCAYPAAGYLGPLIGLEYTFLTFGIIGFIALLVAWRIYPAPDYLELEHIHEELTHTHFHEHDIHHNHLHDDNNLIHNHLHTHKAIRHKHWFVIDYHHRVWPTLNKV